MQRCEIFRRARHRIAPIAAAYLAILLSLLIVDIRPSLAGDAPPGIIFVGCPAWAGGDHLVYRDPKSATMPNFKALAPSCNPYISKCVAAGTEDYPNPTAYTCTATLCPDNPNSFITAFSTGAVFPYLPQTAFSPEANEVTVEKHSHCAALYTTFHPRKTEGCGAKNPNGSCASPLEGNPINIATGNKFQPEVDYPSTGEGTLEYARFYNSAHVGPSWAGFNWTHTWSRSIEHVSTNEVDAVRPDGSALIFNQVGTQWIAESDTPATLTGSDSSGWTLTTRANEIEQYDATGRLLSLATASSRTVTLTYANGTGSDGYFFQDSSSPDSFVNTTAPLLQGTLVKVTDFRGRSLQFYYSQATQTFPWKITDPDGNVYRYQYDSNGGNLVSITYPPTPATSRTYLYNEQAFTANTNLPLALTGIVDENGQRFATFTYDTSGRAISTGHAGNVDLYSITSFGPSSSAYTDPLGSSWTSQVTPIQGVPEITQRQCTSCTGTPLESFTFDGNRNLTSKKDFNGNLTCYTYDTVRNLETSRTEGLSGAGTCAAPQTTSATRTITTAWNATWRVPEKIAEPLRITAYAYNGETGVSCAPAGASTSLLCSKTIQATTDADGSQGFNAASDGSAARTWSYTYNAAGQVLSVNGPRTDVQDTTTYSGLPPDSRTPELGALG